MSVKRKFLIDNKWVLNIPFNIQIKNYWMQFPELDNVEIGFDIVDTNGIHLGKIVDIRDNSWFKLQTNHTVNWNELLVNGFDVFESPYTD